MFDFSKNGLIEFGPRKIRIRKKIGWFEYQDFYIDHGDAHLTQIPIVKPKKFSKLKLFWLKYTPEWYKRYCRYKSHMKFLNKLSESSNLRKLFGTVDYIEKEKARVRTLPPPESEFTGYDPKIGRSVREDVIAAVKEVKEKYNG